MLSRHGLGGVGWRPLSHNGFSGARLLGSGVSAGGSWVLKRTCWEDDWIMRATADVHGREAAFARSMLIRSDRVRSAAVDSAGDGRHFYTLMHDISGHLVQGRVDRASTESIVSAMAELHADRFSAPEHHWCRLDDRLLLLTSGTSALPVEHDVRGLTREVAAGWELFDRRAPRHVRSLLHAVRDDVGLLLTSLDKLPTTSLHGDLKLDNMGVDRTGVLWLIDWALAVRGPACVELGWFMAANAGRLALHPQQVVDLYADVAAMEVGLRDLHDAMTALCGLLLRGWRMALDTETGTGADAFGWWCELAGQAEQFL
ncbi:phosphotransferase family protein [Streptomyces sp. NPDC058051]